MLYDGALRFLFQAAAAMREGVDAQADEQLQPRRGDRRRAARRRSTCRHGEIPQQLQAIYVFCNKLMLEALLERDADKLDTRASCSPSCARPGRRSPAHDGLVGPARPRRARARPRAAERRSTGSPARRRARARAPAPLLAPAPAAARPVLDAPRRRAGPARDRADAGARRRRRASSRDAAPRARRRAGLPHRRGLPRARPGGSRSTPDRRALKSRPAGPINPASCHGSGDCV